VYSAAAGAHDQRNRKLYHPRIQGMNSATTQLFLELRSEVTEKVMAMERRLGAAEEQMEIKASTRWVCAWTTLTPVPVATLLSCL